jgi:signal transduction histidine kinase
MRKHFLFLFLILISESSFAQQQVEVLSTSQFQSHDRLFLAPLQSWVFKAGEVVNGGDPNLDTTDWQHLKPTELSPEFEDEQGRIEGWFRIRIKLYASFENMPLGLAREFWAATEVYLDGELVHSFGRAGENFEAFNPTLKYPVPLDMEVEREYLLAIHLVNYETPFTQREIQMKPENFQRLISLTGPEYLKRVQADYKSTHIFGAISIAVSFLLFFLFWLLVYLNPDQTIFKLVAWLTTAVLITSLSIFYSSFFEISYTAEKIRFLFMITFQAVSILFGLFTLEWMLIKKISFWSRLIFVLVLLANPIAHYYAVSWPFGVVFTGMLIYYGSLFFKNRKTIKGAQWAIVAGVVFPLLATIIYLNIHKYSIDLFFEYEKPMLTLGILSAPLFFLIFISARLKEALNDAYIESQKVLKVTEEKRELLSQQNRILEEKVANRTSELKESLENLKATQSQLIQSEKMASLGELTAGIAHEIQNPLNFVNNFSEVSNELIDEMNEELDKGDIEEAKAISGDIKQNLEKINHHGKRADAIVKGMLQHSRSNSGQKEPMDINALADEYLRLAYHGLRAKDKSFNAEIITDFDKTIGKVNVIPQDIGRVILNLVSNAFYAVHEKQKRVGENYDPTVTVTTKKSNNSLYITVEDNGNGITEAIKEKIFQPFFTTKPTGQGTGLGLSLSYDIVKAHGGALEMISELNKGTTFKIVLPRN